MRICTSINTLSQANVGAPSTTGRRRPPARSAVDGPGRSVRPPCAQIRFWRAASRERLRRRRTPTRHHRGTPARTAWGGRVGDPGAPGADDGAAGESVQCRPGHSPGGAVDVCRVTPQASRRGGWRRSCTHAPAGYLGKFPPRSSPGSPARSTGLPRDDVLNRLPTPFRKSAPPVSAGPMPTVTVSALPSGYNAAGSAGHPGCCRGRPP